MTDPIHNGAATPETSAVIDALAALPEAQRRTVVRTFYAQGVTPVDAAALRRLHLGVHRLRALLEG